MINELYLEDYLKKVVPSEMPASYEKEALKTQQSVPEPMLTVRFREIHTERTVLT